MNAEIFRNNFSKVYSVGGQPIFVFKAAHAITLLPHSGNTDFAVGMGVAPNTYIGIRPSENDIFTVGFFDSEIRYECKRKYLNAYASNDRAAPIFRTIGRFLNDYSVNGAEIYFEYEKNFGECETAAAFAFSYLSKQKIVYENLFASMYSETADYCETAKRIITFSSVKNRCEIFQKNSLSYALLPLDNCNVVIATIDCKPIKLCEENAFCKNEKIYFDGIASALKNGKYIQSGEIIKQAATDYLSSCTKKCEKLKFLFEISSKRAVICGLYGQKGIYAIVENEKVDFFVKDVGTIYEQNHGNRPDFYIGAASSSQTE